MSKTARKKYEKLFIYPDTTKKHIKRLLKSKDVFALIFVYKDTTKPRKDIFAMTSKLILPQRRFASKITSFCINNYDIRGDYVHMLSNFFIHMRSLRDFRFFRVNSYFYLDKKLLPTIFKLLNQKRTKLESLGVLGVMNMRTEKYNSVDIFMLGKLASEVKYLACFNKISKRSAFILSDRCPVFLSQIEQAKRKKVFYGYFYGLENLLVSKKPEFLDFVKPLVRERGQDPFLHVRKYWNNQTNLNREKFIIQKM